MGSYFYKNVLLAAARSTFLKIAAKQNAFKNVSFEPLLAALALSIPLRRALFLGAYTPNDPALSCTQKVGFGTSVRGKGSLVAQANPGPGAYEQRSTVGQGQMVTAQGRHATSYMRARSLPGPGAYNPSMHYAYPTLPRCGFGTSTRDDIAARSRNMVNPGPGTYELQNFRTVGTDTKKFSCTSRRRVHDLNSYVTPGPGTYNAHATSFGY